MKQTIFILILIVIGLICLLSFINEPSSVELFKNKPSCPISSIKPTSNRRSIFGAINKLEEDMDEIVYLIKHKNKNNKKYEEMLKWYKNKRKNELLTQQQSRKNAQKAIRKFANNINNELENSRNIINKQAKQDMIKERRSLRMNLKPLEINL